jgi:hypothetical protein
MRRALISAPADGSLQIYRSWPPPPRSDLAMFALALDLGSMFDRYDGYELGRWPDAQPDFGGRRFDAIFSANFIEHIDDPGNHFDDATHRGELPAGESVLAELAAVGLRIETTTRVPFLVDHLLALGREEDDKVSRTLAYWSFTSWCQFVVARRV